MGHPIQNLPLQQTQKHHGVPRSSIYSVSKHNVLPRLFMEAHCALSHNCTRVGKTPSTTYVRKAGANLPGKPTIFHDHLWESQVLLASFSHLQAGMPPKILLATCNSLTKHSPQPGSRFSTMQEKLSSIPRCRVCVFCFSEDDHRPTAPITLCQGFCKVEKYEKIVQ